MNVPTAYEEFVARYQPDAELFVREVFGFQDIYQWQIEALAEYSRGERRIGIKSGHGVGKTTLLAWILWHHILTHFPQKTAVTAPTEKQLFNALWADFQAWGEKLPPPIRALVEVKSDRAELKRARSQSFISIATARADQPEALQGVHSGEGWVLLLGDEASGIAEKVFEAGSGSMSGHNAQTILTGNPVRGQGFFYEVFNKNADIWKTHTVSSLDVPGVNADFALQIERTYGRDSNAFRVRVLGLFPVRDDDTVLPYELVFSSLMRDITVSKTAPVIWGVDPARFGSDRSALAKRQTKTLLEPIKWWVKLDSTELAGRIKHEYDTTPQWLRPQEINVDSIGIGAGVLDRLRELNLPARGVNVSESPAAINAEKYVNLRTELWFKALEWFQPRDVKLPDSYMRPAEGDDLVGELTSVKYKFRPGSGKIIVESKDDMKRRGMRSPDLADSFILTLASDALTLALGRAGATSWNRKLSRPLRSIV